MSEALFSISKPVLNLLLALSERLGEINGMHFNHPLPFQNKNEQLASIKASLELVDIDLSIDQIKKLSNKYLIKAKENDIRVASQLITAYSYLSELNYISKKDFKRVQKEIGPLDFNDVAFTPLSTKELDQLFTPLKDASLHPLLKALLFHYNLRLLRPKDKATITLSFYWQKLILISYNPLFSFFAFEPQLAIEKEAYLKMIRNAKISGNPENFLRFMLKALNESVETYLRTQKQSHTERDRLKLFINSFKGESFTRQDYLRKFKFISAITASRDLRFAVESNLFKKEGDKRLTRYFIN